METLSVEQMKGMTKKEIIAFHETHEISKNLPVMIRFWEDYRESRGEPRELKGTIIYDEDSNPTFIKG